MLDRLQRSIFLRPRDRLYELVLLQHADREGGDLGEAADGVFDRRTLNGYAGSLVAQGLVTRDGDRIRLTAEGRHRLHYLLVDYVRELAKLNEGAHDILRRSMVELVAFGVHRVAFYPFGETAEVAFATIRSLGFELVAVVDDAPDTWGVRFHHLRVQPPAALRDIKPDAVILTTAVFQDAVHERVSALAVPGMRIHRL